MASCNNIRNEQDKQSEKFMMQATSWSSSFVNIQLGPVWSTTCCPARLLFVLDKRNSIASSKVAIFSYITGNSGDASIRLRSSTTFCMSRKLETPVKSPTVRDEGRSIWSTETWSFFPSAFFYWSKYFFFLNGRFLSIDFLISAWLCISKDPDRNDLRTPHKKKSQ